MATIIDFKEEMEKAAAFRKQLYKSALRSGPAFDGKGGSPNVWNDQVFEREIEPAGAVTCSTPLRIGATHNGLDVALVASHSNEGKLVIPAGSTIKLEMLESDREDGTFSPAGPSICIAAPAGGMEVEPDGLVCRLPIGDMEKPWGMAALEFAGSISGGKVDCVLSYSPR